MNTYSLSNVPYSLRRLVSRIISITVLLGSTHCWALTAQVIPLKDLVNSSDIVVYATVQSQTVEALYPNRPQMLFTLSTVKVVECWKGECGDQLVVSQVGGNKGSFAVSLPGAPLLKDKSQVLLFLKRKVKSSEGQNVYVIVGLNQGAYEVSTRDNQSWITHPHAPSSPHSSTEVLPHPKAADHLKSIRFSQFKTEVLALIEKTQATSGTDHSSTLTPKPTTPQPTLAQPVPSTPLQTP